MHEVEAIGFDLFNTLLVVRPEAMAEAHGRLLRALRREGLALQADAFRDAYVEAALGFFREARKEGRETHNRFWIAAALEREGHDLSPEDERIGRAVEAYFSAFYPHCELLPGTESVLEDLSVVYPLGLLTNFTHPPAARRILEMLGLPRFFRTVLISGELGYRKPHPRVFARLVREMGLPGEQMLYVGDDVDADVLGAREFGLQPAWSTCVRDGEVPSATSLLSPARTECPPDVPRISTWEDLRALVARDP